MPNIPSTAWRELIETLAGFDRPSASDGERRGAELIRERLAEYGCTARVEEERAHGGYWWPIGLANAGALAAALVARRHPNRPVRAAAALTATTAFAALWDDLGHGRRWFRRALLPHRPTWNVVGETGNPAAERTLVVIAHHDAAHSGFVFHPAFGEIGPRLFPKLHARQRQTAPILYAVVTGPAMIAVAAAIGRRPTLGWGAGWALGTMLAMADIGLRAVVPGANDNLSAVGVLVALAERLQREPLDGARVLLLSTGSEESFSEGMHGFLERHAGELDPERTEMLCLECVGGGRLSVLEGEGMLRMRMYPQSMRDELGAAGDDAGIPLRRGIRTVAASDALFALRAGYPVATLVAVEDSLLPRNYHWPNDVPEELSWETVEQAIDVTEAFLRRRAVKS